MFHEKEQEKGARKRQQEIIELSFQGSRFRVQGSLFPIYIQITM